MAIIAPVDQSEKATDVISEAEDLAEAFGESVHVVHVMTRSEFIGLDQTVNNTRDAIDIDQARDRAREIAATVADDVDAPVQYVGLFGKPAQRIIEYAAENNTRYIVLAARKRSPSGKVLFGSTSQAVLLDADCPVVTTIK